MRAIQHSSASVEHYTPPEVADAARMFMGSIDLDPFSCATANQFVKATVFWSAGGFSEPWECKPGRCNVFVNPPGGTIDGTSLQMLGWESMIENFTAGKIKAGVFVCFNLNLLQSSQGSIHDLTPLDYPICYPSKRIRYWTNHLPGPTKKQPNRKPTARQRKDFARLGACQGNAPPHPSCFVGVGGREHDFHKAFSPFGRVIFPRGPIG